MFQYGLNTTVSISSLKSGVSLPRLPTTTRMSITGLPFSRAIRWKCGMLTMKCRVTEIVRHPAPAVHVERDLRKRSSIGTFSAASVTLSTMPVALI